MCVVIFVASVSYRKLDIGLGMMLINLYHAQAMIVLELIPFGDLAAYLKKNQKYANKVGMI